MRWHASSVAHDVGMAVPRIRHDTSSCKSVGSITRHDAKLSCATLSHARRHQRERMSCSKQPTSPSLVEINIGQATCHACCSGRWHSCLGTQARHQQLRERWQHHGTRCQAVACHAESRRHQRERLSCSMQQVHVAVIVEVACKLCCSGRCHGCLATRLRNQQLQECWQHRQARCQAVACHAPSRRQR